MNKRLLVSFKSSKISDIWFVDIFSQNLVCSAPKVTVLLNIFPKNAAAVSSSQWLITEEKEAKSHSQKF